MNVNSRMMRVDVQVAHMGMLRNMVKIYSEILKGQITWQSYYPTNLLFMMAAWGRMASLTGENNYGRREINHTVHLRHPNTRKNDFASETKVKATVQWQNRYGRSLFKDVLGCGSTSVLLHRNKHLWSKSGIWSLRDITWLPGITDFIMDNTD